MSEGNDNLDSQSVSQSQSQAKKRVRGANWTAAETAKLTAFCCENTEILDAELSGAGRKHGNVTADQQQALWKKITDIINGCVRMHVENQNSFIVNIKICLN